MTIANLLGFGTAAIGRPQYINLKQDPTQKAFNLVSFRDQGMAMLDAAYAGGIRYFDTAPGYGLAQDLLIDWLAMTKHTDIVLATKWGYTYVANFEPNAILHEVKEHSLQKLNEQWEVSKKLLPHLKYYQVHSATLDSGVLENQSVLERLFALKQQYNLIVGVSTTGPNQAIVLEKAMGIQCEGVPLFGVFQCTYNLLDQSIASLGKAIVKSGKKLVIKEALANGRLMPHKDYQTYAHLYDLLEKLANKYEVGVDAIALQFCLGNMAGATILSGASTQTQLSQNLQSQQFKLTSQELNKLAAFGIDPEAYWSERSSLAWN